MNKAPEFDPRNLRQARSYLAISPACKKIDDYTVGVRYEGADHSSYEISYVLMIAVPGQGVTFNGRSTRCPSGTSLPVRRGRCHTTASNSCLNVNTGTRRAYPGRIGWC